jgi:site-specific DNA recombinase
MKVVGYVRVSTAEQAAGGESLEMQKAAITAYAKKEGYQLVKIYEDAGISGAKLQRPALMRLENDAKQGKFQKVIFKKLTRFGRNARDLITLYDRFDKEYGIGLVSLEEQIDTSTSAGRLVRTIFSGMAEFERDTIENQMREGKYSKLRKNEAFIGRVPFGYAWNKEGKTMEVAPIERDIYLDIVSMYLDEGLSLTAIAERLNRDSTPTPNKTRGIKFKNRIDAWTTITLSTMLRNPCYKGESVLNKRKYEMVGERSRRAFTRTGGKYVPLLKDERDWVTFKFPPIISEERWQAIQAKTTYSKTAPRHVKYPEKFFAHGFIYCGYCGSRVSIVNGAERQDGTAPGYYRCYYEKATDRQLKADRKERCSCPRLTREEVDNYLWQEALNFIAQPKRYFAAAFEKSEGGQERLKQEKANIERLMAQTEREIKNFRLAIKETDKPEMVKMFTEDITTSLAKKAEYLTTVNRINREIETLNRKVESLDALNSYSKHRIAIKKALATLPDSEKKHVIRLMIEPERGGRVSIGPLTLGDVADTNAKLTQEEASKPIPGEHVVEIDCALNSEKFVNIINYLKNKHLLSVKSDINSSDYPA